MWRTLLHFGSLRGRASRQEYCWVFALTVIAMLGTAALQDSLDGRLLVAGLVSNLLATYLFVAVSVRRLNDIGKSGWLLLLWPVPIVGVVLIAWSIVRRSTP